MTTLSLRRHCKSCRKIHGNERLKRKALRTLSATMHIVTDGETDRQHYICSVSA